MASEVHSTGRGKNLYHGIVYQLKWLMLFLKRAMDKEYSFRLAIEMKSVNVLMILFFSIKEINQMEQKKQYGDLYK
ncbi:MAG: hypothetical protein PV340_04210 [Wolbachia sp.]|nr:hypothetical protein [Wolbachia sp.]